MGDTDDIKGLMAHLEDEYRKSKISEKSYQELKATYVKKLEELSKAGKTQEPVTEAVAAPEEAEPKETKEEKQEEKKEKKGLIGGLLHRKHRDEEGLSPKPEKDGKPAAESNIDEETGEAKMYGTGSAEDPYRSTPEIQQPQEEVAVEEQKPVLAAAGDVNTAVQIELEKTKAMIDNLREMKQATDETIRQMSESMGEIRSMVFQSDGNLKEMEMRVEQIKDEISDVKPSEISKKFKEANVFIESFQINSEKFDKKIEDLTTKTNEVYEMLRGIGGLENLVNVNKDVQKKIAEMNELSKYVERLAMKVEKIFVDMNKNLDDFVTYKIKQDGMFDSVNEVTKSMDGINLKFEGYSTKKDFQTLEEDILVIKKQIEDVTREIPMIKINLPEPVMAIRKRMDDIRLLLETIEEQHRNGRIGGTDYNKIRDVNKKKLEDLGNEVRDEWNKIISGLRSQSGTEEIVPEPVTENTVSEEPRAESKETKEELKYEPKEEKEPVKNTEEIKDVPREPEKEEPVKRCRKTKKEMQELRAREVTGTPEAS